jgi:hypothetical protein
MSPTELLLKEIETLPAKYVNEILNHVIQLKHKAPPVEETALAAEWVNPLKGRARALGSKLTYNRFVEMQEADKRLERELDP